MNKLICYFVTTAQAVTLLAACPLPTTAPDTCQKLMKTIVFNKYIIDESPKGYFSVLSPRDEFIVVGNCNNPGQDLPVCVRLMATSEGDHVNVYDRSPAARESALS